MILSLLVVFALAAAAASLANAATYEWAWNRRRLSPWQPTPDGVAPRDWLDRTPIIGWLRLRRDAATLGGGFWVRPMLVEFAFGAALAALWWWEVWPVVALVTEQPLAAWPAGGYPAWQTFTLHAVLAWLMLVATLIDIDEKTIPDEITVPGALIGLVLATLLPMGHVPNVEERFADPGVGVSLRGLKGVPLVGPNGGRVYAEPTHVTAPNEWPAAFDGGPGAHTPLLIGLGCYALWCFALTPRVWRTRHGLGFGLAVLLRRVARELNRRPLREILLGGVLAICCVWYTGGGAWQGLLTALIGMILSGATVWSVRVVGSLALGKEAMGFGDVTLMFMIGAFLGWQAGLMVFFLAPFAGLLIGLSQLVLRRGDVIPYGPFLCLAAAFVVVRWGVLWPRAEGLFALGAVLSAVLIVCLTMLGLLLAVWRQFKLRVLGISEDWDDD